MSKLLEHNNISLPKGAKKYDVGNKTEDHERCHVLKEGFSQSKAFLIVSITSNHMVSLKESFTTMDLSGVPRIHMGDDSQIPVVPSLEVNLLSIYQMTLSKDSHI